MRRVLGALAIAIAVARVASAGPVDGALDAAYGAARSVQTTQTSLGDWPANWTNGSELDAAYGYVAGDTLHVLIAGSFNRYYGEPLIAPNLLQLFVDCAAGGQNTLSPVNPALGGYVTLPSMSGLTFDADFAPDYWLAVSLERSGFFGQLVAYAAELPGGGGGAGAMLGITDVGGDGTLAGGTNPFGVLVAVDLSNTAGVTGGCDAASGAGVTTGFEWAIPLAALGHPTGAIRICALLASTGTIASVSNQVLGPVPPGTCALGPAATVDLGAIPGPQYFTIDAPVPVLKRSWGGLKAAYR